MSSHAKALFGVAAVAVLSVLSYVCFRGEAAVVEPVTAASLPEDEPALAIPASAPTARTAPPEVPSYIPYDQLTTVAKTENRVIYTTSAMGEPMEVYPDGTVVIHNHRKVFTYADGRQEVRYARITARPAWIPTSGIVMPPGDAPPPK